MSYKSKHVKLNIVTVKFIDVSKKELIKTT